MILLLAFWTLKNNQSIIGEDGERNKKTLQN